MSSPQINPLEGLRVLQEATTDSLTILMSRDPLDMTKEHVWLIVEELRATRARWAIAELAGKKSLPKIEKKSLPKPTEPEAPKDMEF